MNQERNARILVVEDNEDNRHLLSIYLTREGYDVLEARDGEEALAIALAESPDLVVSDVQMPRMDGYTLCRQLKENPQTELIPVILITAVHTSLEDTLEGLHQGANDFISRPFRRSELLARVRTQVRIKELQDRLVQAERVATIGRMTVTMAHEINNPLAGILGHVELLLQELGREPVVEEELRFSLARVQRDALQIRDVLNRLREISRPEVYEYAPGLEGISLDEGDGEEKGRSGSP
jgi:DNA-binding response OmpR family regulator